MIRSYSLIVFVGLLLLFFAFGCEEEALTDEEILARILEAQSGANSYEFEMDYKQKMSMPGIMEMDSIIIASGKIIESPPAMYMDMTMSMVEGMSMQIEAYLVDNLMYMYLDGMGWFYTDASADMDIIDTVQEPADFIKALENLDPDQISFALEENEFTLELFDESGDFLNDMMDEIFDSGAAIFGDEMSEGMYGEISFSQVEYALTVDADTFYPNRVTFSFLLDMTIMDEPMQISQTGSMTMFNHGAFDEITVPDSVLDEAVELDEAVF